MAFAVRFDKEVNTTHAAIDAGTFTTQTDAYFWQVGIAAGSRHLDLLQPSGFACDVSNRNHGL